MIRFSFAIKNPWAKDFDHHDYFYKYKQLSKNKTFEIQLFRSSSYNLFNVDLETTWRGEDHAGPRLTLELGKYQLDLKIYDHRHWNYKTGTWRKSGEEFDND